LRFQLPKSLRSQEQAGEASKSKDVEQTPSADNAKMQRAKALEAHNIESGEKSGENGKWEMGNRRAADWKAIAAAIKMHFHMPPRSPLRIRGVYAVCNTHTHCCTAIKACLPNCALAY